MKYILILPVIILLGAAFYIGRTSGTQIISSSNSVGQKTDVPKPKITRVLNKEFSFSLRNDKNEEVNKYKYIVESAGLQDEILLKGQKATAVKGKTFLIFNLKLVNNFDKGASINTRDYIRLSTDGKEWLAPDLHSDPIDIQAISTKYARIGFTVDEKFKNFKVRVGEIDKNKTDLNLTF